MVEGAGCRESGELAKVPAPSTINFLIYVEARIGSTLSRHRNSLKHIIMCLEKQIRSLQSPLQAPTYRPSWRLTVLWRKSSNRHYHHQHTSTSRSASPANGPSPTDQVAEPQAVLLDEPLSPMDVDQELWVALDMCTDDELEALYKILHSTSPFSPIIKSLLVD